MDLPDEGAGPEPAGGHAEESAAWQRRLSERGAADQRQRIRREADRARDEMDRMMAQAAREAGGSAETLTAEVDARDRLLHDLIGRADSATRRLNQALERADKVTERVQTTTVEAEARLATLLDGLLTDLRSIGDDLEWG